MRHAPVVVAWREVAAASPLAPLRFLEAPGLALLRQNVAWLRTETNPLPTHLERLARGAPREVLAVFGPERLAEALAGCQRLASLGVKPIAARGRWLPQEVQSDFSGVSFAAGLLPRLTDLGRALPESWTLPVVLAELYHPRVTGLKLGSLFSRPPEPGVLDVRDLCESGRREGAVEAALPIDVSVPDASRLLDRFAAMGVRSALVIDLGGDAAGLAALALRRDMLGGWLGPASSPLPESVRRSGCPVFTWFEPADTTVEVLSGRPRLGGGSGVAWVPVGLADEGVAAATERLLHVRSLGYAAAVPRYFVPSPNTREWQRMEVRFGLRATRLDRLGGEHLVFDLPEWRAVEGPEVLEIWRRDDRWPDPATAHFTRRRSTSFEAMRQSIDAYLVDAAGRVPECHARDLLADLLAALGPAAARLEEIERYPFVAISGRSLLDVVQHAVEARLLSLGSLPPDLIAAIRHASLVGGKRIRPILTLATACALGVPLDAALPAALATEWLHTASLIQDDLPCMDDDDVRRRDVSTHRRHGEAIALLASDTLIALAFQDLAALHAHPAVGAVRTVRLMESAARTIGGEGLVGGQVRDLLTRRLDRVTLQEVLDVHRRKTAPLFRLTATLACLLADVEEPLATRLADTLSSMGLAFQVVDDVLDATPGNDSFGRPAGSDRRNNLPTFATLMDSQEGRRYARKLMEPHAAVLEGRADLFGLERLSTYVLERRQ